MFKAHRLLYHSTLGFRVIKKTWVGFIQKRRCSSGMAWRKRKPRNRWSMPAAEREVFIDNLLVRIHFIIVMVRRTGLAPWKFEFNFPGSLTSTFLLPRPTLFQPSL